MRTPEATRAIAPDARIEPGAGPLFTGIAIATTSARREITPADEACGIFVQWRGTA